MNEAAKWPQGEDDASLRRPRATPSEQVRDLQERRYMMAERDKEAALQRGLGLEAEIAKLRKEKDSELESLKEQLFDSDKKSVAREARLDIFRRDLERAHRANNLGSIINIVCITAAGIIASYALSNDVIIKGRLPWLVLAIILTILGVGVPRLILYCSKDRHPPGSTDAG